MKKLYLLFIFSLIPSVFIAQNKKILVFDPNNVSANFQYTLSQLTDDSVFVSDTLDDSIFNYDGLFLFVNPPYELSQQEGNRLIQYTSENKFVYLYTGIFPLGTDSVAFWSHIGVEDIYGLLISVPIDTVIGVTGMFTEDIIIDTSFMSGLVPVIIGNVDSILVGKSGLYTVNTTFKSGYDSLNVIIDIYNLIADAGFLEKVLQKFDLISTIGNDDNYRPLTDFFLYQNYPNPFNPSTKIRFAIPFVGTGLALSVQLKVYDILGNEIATLVNEEKAPGTYKVEFNATKLSSGIYFYKLQAGNFKEVKKMVLVK